LRLEAPPLEILTESQLFGERARQERGGGAPSATRRRSSELSDLRIGAPVVHETYGVGRYVGLQTMDVAATAASSWCSNMPTATSCTCRCSAASGVALHRRAADTAPLHKLGGDQWQKARRKAAQRIRDVAAELLDLYSRRAAAKAPRSWRPEAEYRAFQAGFPFEETADQADGDRAGACRSEGSGKPMDRVICGDVGFGKTEVALRAAFVAVQAGKQVAVLVPTTLLAQQHYTSFHRPLRRLAGARREPVALPHATRRPTRCSQGRRRSVDIVIATQRLLQGRTRFKDLGLVVIDEEHRFGVRDKEKLKALRAEVDVLTLTATPIPRTLNMAMGGLRDLSLITTPPAERLAVKTFVLEWNETVVREAACANTPRRPDLLVHNTIETSRRPRRRCASSCPRRQVAVGHGQMRERDLEQLMLDFYHRRFNVLVCTTIIESGIDVPTANTIVIDRADRFGLAQIHQLRGRVGRSHHRAYAYLITPPRKGDDRRCRQAPRGARVARGTRRGLHARHARPGDPRRRRAAWATSRAARSRRSASTCTWSCWSARSPR
jgi:transcription-repair coupling factor (superfamily II helicase)